MITATAMFNCTVITRADDIMGEVVSQKPCEILSVYIHLSVLASRCVFKFRWRRSVTEKAFNHTSSLLLLGVGMNKLYVELMLNCIIISLDVI